MQLRWIWSGTVTAAVALIVFALRPEHTIDLAVYRQGAWLLLHGHAESGLYDFGVGRLHLPFTYPPFAVLVFAPLGIGSLSLWAVVVRIGLCFVLAALVELSVRTTGRRVSLPVLIVLTLVAAALEPVWMDLKVGQISLVLVAIVTLDLVWVPPRWRGVLTGVAAAIKLTPLIFLVFLAFTRQWRTLAVATGTFVAAGLIGLAALPHASLTYWRHDVVATNRVGSPYDISDQSIHGVLVRLGLAAKGVRADLVWLGVAGVVAALTLVIAACWWRRGDRLLGVALTGLAGLFLSPISWYHHWCWVVPLLIALAARSRIAGLLALAGLAVGRFLPEHQWGEGHARHWDAVQQVFGNGYVWIGLLVVAYAAAELWRTRGLSTGGRSGLEARAASAHAG